MSDSTNKGQISEDAILMAGLKAIKKAHNEYENMCGSWLWEAPEYFTTTVMAQSLVKLMDGESLTLENSVKDIIKDAGGINRGKIPTKMRSNGRADITIWRANTTPRAVIEIKTAHPSNSLSLFQKDIDRIIAMLNSKSKENSLSFGLIYFYLSKKAKKSITAKEQIQVQLNNLEQELSQFSKLCKITMENLPITVVDEDAWVAVALKFKK
jgi:hypothetical protein